MQVYKVGHVCLGVHSGVIGVWGLGIGCWVSGDLAYLRALSPSPEMLLPLAAHAVKNLHGAVHVDDHELVALLHGDLVVDGRHHRVHQDVVQPRRFF